MEKILTKVFHHNIVENVQRRFRHIVCAACMYYLLPPSNSLVHTAHIFVTKKLPSLIKLVHHHMEESTHAEVHHVNNVRLDIIGNKITFITEAESDDHTWSIIPVTDVCTIERNEIQAYDNGNQSPPEVIYYLEPKTKSSVQCIHCFCLEGTDQKILRFLGPSLNKVKPDHRDVYKLLKSKCNNWYKIGLYFGVSRNDLEQSNTRFGGTTEADMKLESVLYKWKETKCSERSWDNVIKTLEDLNYIDVVGEVKEYLLHGSGKEKYDTRDCKELQKSIASNSPVPTSVPPQESVIPQCSFMIIIVAILIIIILL